MPEISFETFAIKSLKTIPVFVEVFITGVVQKNYFKNRRLLEEYIFFFQERSKPSLQLSLL